MLAAKSARDLALRSPLESLHRVMTAAQSNFIHIRKVLLRLLRRLKHLKDAVKLKQPIFLQQTRLLIEKSLPAGASRSSVR